MAIGRSSLDEVYVSVFTAVLEGMVLVELKLIVLEAENLKGTIGVM